MAFIPHVRSSKNVTLYLQGTAYVVPVGTPQYDLAIAAIEAGDETAALNAVQIRKAIVNMSQGKITLDGNTLTYDGRPLHGSLVNRILTIVKDAGDAGPLLAFLDNLMQNPSKRAVDELYGFLDACDLPITIDGHFLAYKKVNSDYTSVHDGTTKNNIGLTVSMPRNAVNDNQNETCSHGLHFCSEGYLAHFGGSRIVVLKINPRDVVSIPTDYKNAKGRACSYEVIGELDVTGNGKALVKKLSADFDTTFVPKTAIQTLKDQQAAKADAKKAPAPLVSDVKTAPLTKTAGLAGKQTAVGQGTLSDQNVRDIRSMLKDNWSIASIAKAIGTSTRTVARIRDGETYTHVK